LTNLEIEPLILIPGVSNRHFVEEEMIIIQNFFA